MKCFNVECHTQKLNECLVFDDKKECRHFISESEETRVVPVDSQSAGSVLIDSDYHKAFIELLTAARDFISGSSLNAERYNRLGDAIIALNQFEPNDQDELREKELME